MAAVGVVAAMIALASRGQRPATTPDPAPNTDGPAMRIVSLAPGITEMLFALGLGDSVVGATDYCTYPEAAKKIERIGGFASPNMEKVLSLRPTLVIGGIGARKDVLETTRASGTDVLLVTIGHFEKIFTAFLEIGEATGTLPRAQKHVAAMRAELAEIAGRYKHIPEERRPRVFVEIWNDPLQTVGRPSFLNDVVARAGGINVAGGIDENHPRISPEKVIEWNPDVIVAASMAGGGQTAEDVAGRIGWKDIAAVKSGRIITDIPMDHLLRPGPRLIKGVRQLAERLYPAAGDAPGKTNANTPKGATANEP